MANPRYNTQVTQPRGGSARVGKMGGGMMMQRPMMKKGGRVKKFASKIKDTAKKILSGNKIGKDRARAGIQDLARVKKMGGGRIAGAARRAQEHGYYTPDMGMRGGRMYKIC